MRRPGVVTPWSAECRAAFRRVKSALIANPIYNGPANRTRLFAAPRGAFRSPVKKRMVEAIEEFQANIIFAQGVLVPVSVTRLERHPTENSGVLRMLKKLIGSILLSFTLVGYSGVIKAETSMTVLVTGANRGIGLELVRQLRARGHHLIGTARNPEEATDLKETGALVLPLDVTDGSSVLALAEALEGRAIDLLINNAGIMGHSAKSFAETDFDEVITTFDVNSLGPMRVTQALLPNLLAGNGKTVVQISSTMGSIANNSGGYYGYRASKSALNMLNKSLALELADLGITAVVLHPGWVQTRLGGANAAITPQESVTGMLLVIAGLGPQDNGRFLDYKGEELPW